MNRSDSLQEISSKSDSREISTKLVGKCCFDLGGWDKFILAKLSKTITLQVY